MSRRLALVVRDLVLPLVLAVVLEAQVRAAPQAGPKGTVSAAGEAVEVVPLIESDDLRFSRLSTAQGLSQTRVAQIVQDDRGFMWFGTQYGLNRYDGYSYKVFTHDPASDTSLSCVYI